MILDVDERGAGSDVLAPVKSWAISITPSHIHLFTAFGLVE
jgi:hypothetical protein